MYNSHNKGCEGKSTADRRIQREGHMLKVPYAESREDRSGAAR